MRQWMWIMVEEKETERWPRAREGVLVAGSAGRGQIRVCFNQLFFDGRAKPSKILKRDSAVGSQVLFSENVTPTRLLNNSCIFWRSCIIVCVAGYRASPTKRSS